jgi:dipeptidase E
MKLLLTSAGVKNPTIREALVGLLGKPVEESNALFIPTGGYGNPYGSPAGVWRNVSGNSQQPMVELGWKSVGVLELTALPTMEERWIPWVRETDILLVSGGDACYLSYWMGQSGLADLFPSLTDTVYMGFSAGSMVLTPRIGSDFMGWKPPIPDDDSTLGVVDFSIFPHVDHPDLPENTMAAAQKWAAEVQVPAYAIDDDTAIKVVDGSVELVTEGHWRRFN